MNCRDAERFLIAYARGEAIPPDAAAHIAGCPRCGELVRVMGAGAPVPGPERERLEHIESGILADLKPVKPLPPPSSFFAGLMLILAVVAAIGGGLLGGAGWLALSGIERAAILTTVAGGASLLALSAARQMFPGSKMLFAPDWLIGAVIAALACLFAILFHPREEQTFVATGLVCLRIGLEFAILAGALFWMVLRRGAILNPVWTGATAGTLAGLAGLTVLEIFCPNFNRNHVLVWHVGAVLLSTCAGTVIGVLTGRRPARS
jgi:hypothetical protein